MLIGRGDGTFTTGATLPIPLFESFAVSDVNHDGIVDVVIPDTYRNSVSAFLGRRDGGFASPIVSTVNPQPGLVPTHIMVGDGTGRFTTTESYPVQIGRTIIADDFNHDRRPDLAVTEALGQTAVLLHN